MTRANFTPTQWRIMELLADGLRHSIAELHKCVNDDLTTAAVVRVNLAHLRRKLRPNGSDIVFERQDNISYYRFTKINES